MFFIKLQSWKRTLIVLSLYIFLKMEQNRMKALFVI